MSQTPQSETVQTTGELAAAGGKVPPMDADAVDMLRNHNMTFMDRMPGDPKSHAMTMAKPHLEQFIFWLRAHLNSKR